MKKILLLSVSLFLLIVSGCSSNKSTPVEEDVVEENNAVEEIANQEITEEVKYEKGLVENGVYTNSSLNIKFTPTENMVVSTEEEMLAQYENGAELIKNGNESFKNIDFSSFDIIYELIATDVTTGSNIQIMAEKVALSNITPNQYIKAIASQLGQVDGFEVTNQSEIEDYDIGGVNYSKCTIYINYSGVDLSETYLCSKVGDRTISIIVTCMQESDLDTFLGCFSSLK